MKRALLIAIILGGCISAFAQGICDSTPSACVSLTGVIAGANGTQASNYVLNFQPSQIFYIGGVGTIINTTSNCATSVDGSVVKLQNPLSKTQVSPQFTGTLTSGTYYTRYTFYDYSGNQTLPSPEIVTQLVSTGGLTVAIPSSGLPDQAIGMRVYMSATPNTETLQGSTTGTGSFVQSTPLTTGAALPATNTTVCKMVANDAVWPTGTGYITSLTDTAGNTIPGYPMQWQLMGAGTTINLSNGLPYYHGVTYFPTPIIANGVAGGNQVLNGNLTIAGNLTANTGQFTTLATPDTTAYNVFGMMLQNPVFHAPWILGRTQITNTSLSIPYIDAGCLVQQGTVPSGHTFSEIPAGGTTPVNQFNIGCQFESIIADNAATTTGGIAVAILGGNISSAPTTGRNSQIVLETDNVTEQNYVPVFDSYGQTPGSPFWDNGILATNIETAVGGIGVFSKSNAYKNGGIQRLTKWVANTPGWQLNSVVVPSAAGNYPTLLYRVVVPSSYFGANTSGTTGNVEPTWCLTNGCTVTDGSGATQITWKAETNIGQGAWSIGFSAINWINSGIDVLVDSPYESDNAIVLRGADNTYCVNQVFTQHDPNTGLYDWIMGENCTGNGAPGYFDLYNRVAGVQAIQITPTGDLSLNSGAGYFHLTSNGGVGTIQGGLSLTSNFYAATGISSGAGYDSTTGYKSGGVSIADSSGNVTAGGGSNIVYRCLTAGTSPIGTLTVTAANCGTSTDTGLRVK